MSGRLAVRGLTFIAILTALGGCSQYLDRRDTIALDGGNAMAADKATMMVDPWPRWAAERNIAFNGARMESAVERYRTNHVIPPQGTGTSAAYQAPSNAAPDAPTPAAPVGPTIAQENH